MVCVELATGVLRERCVRKDEEMDYENGRSDRWNTEKLTMRSMGTDEKRDEVEVVGK
jgi:hypothetical protein